ncbi:MAG TPA: ribosome maturation factor RimM [Ignavibacteriaceae bacterium]
MTEYFLIGRIESAAGSDGFVKISSQSDFPERFSKLSEVYIDFWGDKKKFIVEKVTLQKNKILLKFKRFESLRDIELLISREIFVTDEKVVSLPEDSFFIHDLIGSKVFIGDKLIGEIKEVEKLPSNDVILIRSNKGKELLLPLIDKFVLKFDPSKKIMLIRNDVDLNDDED